MNWKRLISRKLTVVTICFIFILVCQLIGMAGDVLITLIYFAIACVGGVSGVDIIDKLRKNANGNPKTDRQLLYHEKNEGEYDEYAKNDQFNREKFGFEAQVSRRRTEDSDESRLRDV